MKHYPSEKYEFVNWDDEIPNVWKSQKMFQTTNQKPWYINFSSWKQIVSYSYLRYCEWSIVCFGREWSMKTVDQWNVQDVYVVFC